MAATLESRRFYTFGAKTRVRATPAGDGWWQLTDVRDLYEKPDAPTEWKTWAVSPTGAIHEGPVVSTDAGTHAGAPLSMHIDSMYEVVASGEDCPPTDPNYWINAEVVALAEQMEKERKRAAAASRRTKPR